MTRSCLKPSSSNMPWSGQRSQKVSGSVKSLPGKLCLDPCKHRGDPEKPQVLPGQKTAGVWLQLLVRAWLRDRSSFSLHLIAAEWLEVAGRARDVVLGAARPARR